MNQDAKFSVGQMIHHKLFDYRGVVYDVDRSRPPRDAPWYHVLVHGSADTTYVAERHLEADLSGNPVDHPLLASLFQDYRDGRYVVRRTIN